MRSILSAVALLWLGVFGANTSNPQAHTWNFDGDKTNTLPHGFAAQQGDWKVTSFPGAPSPANALAQWAKNDRPVFNLVLIEAAYTDQELSVQMRALDGIIDQGGGLVWRARDARNYYVARYNPLEENFRVYKVVDGRRVQLASADAPKKEGWYTLRVTMRADWMECWLDGKKYLEARDSTFSGPGKIGLWTKADAQTLFDNLTVSSLP